MPQDKYDFPVQTSQGVGIVSVPIGEFKRCRDCHHDLFRQLFRVAWKKTGVIGAKPVQFNAQVMVCSECGRELEPGDPTGDDLKKTPGVE